LYEDDVKRAVAREGELAQEANGALGAAGEAAGVAAGSDAAHEDAIVLGIDHRGAVAEKRAFVGETGVVGEDGDARFAVGLEDAEDELVDEGCFAGAAGAGDADDQRIADFRCATGGLSAGASPSEGTGGR